MTTLEVGNRLVALCREGKHVEAIQSLYHPDIVSVEAAAMPGMQREVRGLKEVLGKTKWWTEHHEVHGNTAEGPYPHDDRFAVRFTTDATNKDTKQRFNMEEVALYTVRDGKIVREEFFYKTS